PGTARGPRGAWGRRPTSVRAPAAGDAAGPPAPPATAARVWAVACGRHPARRGPWGHGRTAGPTPPVRSAVGRTRPVVRPRRPGGAGLISRPAVRPSGALPGKDPPGHASVRLPRVPPAV